MLRAPWQAVTGHGTICTPARQVLKVTDSTSIFQPQPAQELPGFKVVQLLLTKISVSDLEGTHSHRQSVSLVVNLSVSQTIPHQLQVVKSVRCELSYSTDVADAPCETMHDQSSTACMYELLTHHTHSFRTHHIYKVPNNASVSNSNLFHSYCPLTLTLTHTHTWVTMYI